MKSCVQSDLLFIASNVIPCFDTSKLQGKAGKLFYEMIQKFRIVLLANVLVAQIFKQIEMLIYLFETVSSYIFWQNYFDIVDILETKI